MVVKSRSADNGLGATKVSRAEWLVLDPNSGCIHRTLTDTSSPGQPTIPNVDATNPRVRNVMGWTSRCQDERAFDGRAFKWSHLVLAGGLANEWPQTMGITSGKSTPAPTHRIRLARCPVGAHRHGPDRR